MTAPGRVTDIPGLDELNGKPKSTPIDSKGTAKDAPRSAPGPKPTLPRSPRRSLERELIQAYMVVGMGLMLIDPPVAESIMTNAESCAKAVNDLCQTNARVYKIVDKLLTGAASGAVFTAHLPIILTALSTHVPSFQPFIQPMAPGDPGTDA